jgi:hypothetical protein
MHGLCRGQRPNYERYLSILTVVGLVLVYHSDQRQYGSQPNGPAYHYFRLTRGVNLIVCIQLKQWNTDKHLASPRAYNRISDIIVNVGKTSLQSLLTSMAES